MPENRDCTRTYWVQVLGSTATYLYVRIVELYYSTYKLICYDTEAVGGGSDQVHLRDSTVGGDSAVTVRSEIEGHSEPSGLPGVIIVLVQVGLSIKLIDFVRP